MPIEYTAQEKDTALSKAKVGIMFKGAVFISSIVCNLRH